MLSSCGHFPWLAQQEHLHHASLEICDPCSIVSSSFDMLSNSLLAGVQGAGAARHDCASCDLDF